MLVALRIYNTLTGRDEEFVPLEDGRVKMYICGMTPKYHPHVGHARIFLAVDALRRYLEYRGYQVRHVQNFTDIDDKIIARAAQEGLTPQEVADKYSRSFFDVLDALNILRAHVYPTVTASMPGIIAFVQGLVEKGAAYVVDGDVYFSVATFAEYGKLSGRTEGEGLVGVRKELEPGKRDPRDFALWKAAKPGEPAWPSPWGPGRPGWHIECSTMVRETLGDQIDIHGGGQDLIFPHHENEIAQSEALTGRKPFARYWFHVGLVTIDGEKMSHSLYNFRTIHDILQVYDPMALRLYLLSTHYRSPIAFSEESLSAAARSLQRLRGVVDEEVLHVSSDGRGAAEGEVARTARERFERAMDDDLNTAGALGHLFDLVREINRLREVPEAAEERRAAQRTLVELAGVLGLRLEPQRVTHDRTVEPFIDLLLTTRQRLRQAKQWELADQIRDGLRRLGVVVEDHPQGTRWRFAEPGEE